MLPQNGLLLIALEQAVARQMCTVSRVTKIERGITGKGKAKVTTSPLRAEFAAGPHN